MTSLSDTPGFDIAEPRLGLKPDDCDFYHSIDLPASGTQVGAWDLRGRFDDYVNHAELGGKTVLDVGAASGFLSFEAERRGARVTSLEVGGGAVLHHLPVAGGAFVEDHERWLEGADAWVEGVRNSYWLSHEEFGSSAQRIHGDVRDLRGPAEFDVVIFGQLLVHLPDALTALAAAARVCSETLIVVEGNFESEDPLARLCGEREVPYAWYHYSHGWYRRVLSLLGFDSVSISVDSYLCNDALHQREIPLATVVATRAG
jgi:SAM-dependent methyltransferase